MDDWTVNSHKELSMMTGRCLTDLLGRCLVEAQRLQGSRGRSRIQRVQLSRLAEKLYAGYRRLPEMDRHELAATWAEYGLVWRSKKPILEWMTMQECWRRVAVRRDPTEITVH